MVKICVIVAKSCSGKDTILKEIIKSNKNVQAVVSTTTRPMRDGEVDGIDYNFITHGEAISRIENGEFIEHREYKTVDGMWVYGVEKRAIDINSDKKYIVILDLNGLIDIEQYMYKATRQVNNVTSVYIKADDSTRLTRSLQREPNANDGKVSEMCRRFLADLEDFKYAETICEHVVINNEPRDLEKAVKEINKIIEEM